MERKIFDEVKEKEAISKNIELLTKDISEKEKEIQMKQDENESKTLNLSILIKENKLKIKQVEKDLKDSHTSINNKAKKEDKLLKQLEKKESIQNEVKSEVSKTKTNTESLEKELEKLTTQLTGMTKELLDTSKKNLGIGKAIDDKTKDVTEQNNSVIDLTSQIKLKEEESRKHQQRQDCKEEEQDMVLKKFKAENNKIVQKLIADIVDLNKKVFAANIEYEKNVNLSNENLSQNNCTAIEQMKYEIIETHKKQKQEKDQFDEQINNHLTEMKRIDMEIKNYTAKNGNTTGRKLSIIKLYEDRLDSDEDTNTARKVMPTMTPRNLVPVMRGPSRLESSRTVLQQPQFRKPGTTSHKNKSPAKKMKMDIKLTSPKKNHPNLFDDIMVCSEEN